jgi:hypothetical protein
MFKKIFINIITTLTLGVLLINPLLLKRWIGILETFFDLDGKIEIYQEKIPIKHLYVDKDIINFSFHFGVAAKKTVYTFQWKEMVVSDKIVYKKVWSEEPIDSSNFFDENKQNHITHNYNNLEIIPDIKISDNIILTSKELAKKIHYNSVDIKSLDGHSNNIFESREILENHEPIEDFNNDLDTYVFSKHSVRKDTFKRIGKNALINSIDIRNPQIGDVKIEYNSFSPEYIIVFRNKNSNVIHFMFSEKTYDFIHSKFLRATIIVIFWIYSATVYILWLISTKNISKYAKRFALNLFPFVSEYIVFGDKHCISFFLTIFGLLFSFGNYYLLLFLFLIFVYLINKNYYSI